ncbi:Lipoprotein [Photobacterium marinum]|uniref:Lipoprotein n=1 Tax=Photobacterium marinum TaxID=1056511 RepID=L8JFK5_9GAMM|nr:copper resistance protein NlpE [Photobacterium marinum]ELR66269.1 Lipoprotein [Photobacterium marinum]
MNKLFLALVIAGFAIAGCDQQGSVDLASQSHADTHVVTENQPQVEQLISVDNAHNARNSLDWNGVYHGILPCADCSGIETTLELRFDGTYMLNEKYLGKKDGEFKTEGKFNWNAAGNAIAVPSDSEDAVRYFVAENQLFRLDKDGLRVTGELADAYTLKKQ